VNDSQKLENLEYMISSQIRDFKELRAEVDALKEEVSVLEAPLPQTEQELPEEFQAKIKALEKQNAELLKRIEVLEQLNKTPEPAQKRAYYSPVPERPETDVNSFKHEKTQNENNIQITEYEEFEQDTIVPSNLYLPYKIIKKKPFLSAMSFCTELNEYDKEKIYSIMQKVYCYQYELSQIPASKHGEPRKQLIDEAIRQHFPGFSFEEHPTKKEAFTTLVSDYITYSYPEWDKMKLQYILNQIADAICNAK